MSTVLPTTSDRSRITRLAPSPTGSLHLGNVRTFLVNWALARQHGWKIVLRMDDLDGPRIKSGADREAIEILRWLGIDWDDGPHYQTERRDRYTAVLLELAAAGAVYPCTCTRSEILAASLSAPHQETHEVRYPGTCGTDRRGYDFFASGGSHVAWRLRVGPGTQTFRDAFAGQQSHSVSEQVGDFLVATKGGQPSYQLAVVVDDLDQGITDVVRGEDLLQSAARQILVRGAMHCGAELTYWHLPLVVGPDGRRLAKRHGDTRITWFRQAGVPASRIVAWVAQSCGVPCTNELTAAQFRQQFDIHQMPHTPVVCSPSDVQRLVGGE